MTHPTDPQGQQPVNPHPYGQPPQQPVNPYPVYGQQPLTPRGGGDRSLLYVLGGVGALVLVVVVVAMGMRGTGDPCLDAPRRSPAEQSAYADQRKAECLRAARAKEQAAYEERRKKYGERAMKPNPRAGEIECALGALGDTIPETRESRRQECEAKRAEERAADPIGSFADDNGLVLGVIGLAALAGGGFFLYRRQQTKAQGGYGYGYVPPPAYSQPMTVDDLTEPDAPSDTDNNPYTP